MSKEAIEQIKEALQLNDELYNRIGNGELPLSLAGKLYDSIVAYKTIRALKVAIEELREVDGEC
jgi:hypothetical protein